jgi:protein-tyrosine-phosphatase
MSSILFVCTANQFRSPIAAAKFTRLLSKKDIKSGWQVSSAGTWATEGLPPHPMAIQAAARLGLELNDHTTREVNQTMLDQADLIVVMEQGQREALICEFPQCKDRICLLAEIAGDPAIDIDDPSRTDFSDVDAVAKRVIDDVQKACQLLMELALRNQAQRITESAG